MSKYPFKDHSRAGLEELFDVRHPGIEQIRERYKSFIDLNRESRLDNRTVAEAIVEAAKNGKAIYIPEGYPMWDESSVFSGNYNGQKVSFELSTPYRFKKFGPEININTTKMGVSEARKSNFHEMIHEKLSDQRAKETMLKGTRGLGYWRPQHKDHVIILWYVFAEGYGYAHQPKLGGRCKVKSRTSDARVFVPSLSQKGRNYDMHILSLPIHKEGGTCNLEILQTEWRGSSCEDVTYREFAGRAPEDEAKIIALRKYSKPEHVSCKHRYSGEWNVYENAGASESPMQAFRYPAPHLLFSKVYDVLKRRTIIGDEKRGRRPTKAQTASACGTVIGLEGPDKMFVFDF
jgi:hypothetical protein